MKVLIKFSIGKYWFSFAKRQIDVQKASSVDEDWWRVNERQLDDHIMTGTDERK